MTGFLTCFHVTVEPNVESNEFWTGRNLVEATTVVSQVERIKYEKVSEGSRGMRNILNDG